MNDLEKMIKNIVEQKEKHIEKLKSEIDDIEERYDQFIMEIIERQLEEPVIRKMTIEQVLEEYGDFLTDQEVKEIKSWKL